MARASSNVGFANLAAKLPFKAFLSYWQARLLGADSGGHGLHVFGQRAQFSVFREGRCGLSGVGYFEGGVLCFGELVILKIPFPRTWVNF